MPGILDAILALSFLGGVAGSTADQNASGTPNAGIPTTPEPQSAPFRRPAARMPVSEQWRRLTAIIEHASDHGMRAHDAHMAAKPLLHEAELELQSIMTDVSAVMALPLGVAEYPTSQPSAQSPSLAFAA